MKKNTCAVLLAAIASFVFFVNSLSAAYPKYQNTRLVDPLSLSNSLPLSFYLSIFIILAASLYIVLVSLDNRYLHLLLLLLLSTMLWATPYLLTSFVRLPLGPWKIAQSVHIEEILRGSPIPLSWYGRDYPGSFVFNQVFLSIAGFDALVYVRWVFPLVQLASMILLMYVFLTRIFNRIEAFLAVLLTIPGLHYVVLQPAPNSLGLILVLASLVVITRRELQYAMIFVSIAFTLVLTHSVYSVLLLIIFSAAVIVRHILGEFKIRAPWRILVALLVLFLIWETAAVSRHQAIRGIGCR